MYNEVINGIEATLDTMVRVATRGTDRAVLSMAHEDVPRLVDAFRSLMDGHTPDENGCCRACARRRALFGRRHPVPCRLVLSARLALLNARHGAHSKHAMGNTR
ncbi:hypothetical protein F0L68_37945 [Solihabitans fulvus]|uniref:Uncharacterized protein n=1 Tax=Solihabitans fulvus TaxID=1892852 RepID=A0A5B2WL62_9PSEU|nr:hypothetical protein [Solihabitans fulvus]KAA2251209.1 hypothetical protein F0L68_37945 [Solihabitans fulvus]